MSSPTKITANMLADGSALANVNSGASITLTKAVSMSSTLAVTGNATFSGNLTVDTNTFFVDSVNNRVGVGTATPASAFAVKSPSTSGLVWDAIYSANSNPIFRLSETGSGTTAQLTLYSVGGGADIRFNVGGNSYFASGHFGIGNSNPQYKLDVTGTFNASSNTTIGGTLTTTGKITTNGQGALSSLSNNDVMTRILVDSLLCDTDVLYLRDEFYGVFDGAAQVGELGWGWSGTGANVRPSTPSQSFGSLAIVTAATRRASINLMFDASNIVGGNGNVFSTNGMENSSTVVKYRIYVNTLASSIAAGFNAYSSTTFKNNRFFGLRYSLPATAWSASTAIAINEYRRPTTANGRRYYASVAGTTSGSEPTWPTSGNVVDGTVTWTEDGIDGNTNFILQNCPNTSNELLSTVVDSGIPVAINTWYAVVMTHVSGSTWNFTINGVNAGNIAMTTNRDHSLAPVFKCESHAIASVFMSIDYFIWFSRGIIRP